MKAEARLYYAHDPMCSWCWGFAPMWDKLENELTKLYSDQLRIEKLLGGLAADSDEEMPEHMQQYLQKTWQTIQQKIPGTQFNFDFWKSCKPRRSTWPACRAIIAARNQQKEFDGLMTWAIQQAYYLKARNPSDRDTLISLAGEIGADKTKFAEDLDAEETRNQHDQEMQWVRQLGIQGFPSLVLVFGQQANGVQVDFGNTQSMLVRVEQLLTAVAA